MSGRSFIRYAKDLVRLFLFTESRRRKNFAAARRRLNKLLASEDNPPAYLIGMDAGLMVREARHAEARARFLECLKTLPVSRDSEDQYIALHCRLWLAMYDVECTYPEMEELRSQAASLQVRGVIKRSLLPNISEKMLRMEFGHRGLPLNPSSSTFNVIRRSVRFDEKFSE